MPSCPLWRLSCIVGSLFRRPLDRSYDQHERPRLDVCRRHDTPGVTDATLPDHSALRVRRWTLNWWATRSRSRHIGTNSQDQGVATRHFLLPQVPKMADAKRKLQRDGDGLKRGETRATRLLGPSPRGRSMISPMASIKGRHMTQAQRTRQFERVIRLGLNGCLSESARVARGVGVVKMGPALTIVGLLRAESPAVWARGRTWHRCLRGKTVVDKTHQFADDLPGAALQTGKQVVLAL